MSLLDVFPCAYPPVSPIRKGFKVGVCIHGDYSPERLALVKAHGFDHVLADWVPYDHAKKVYDNAKAAGLEVLALQEGLLGTTPYFGDKALTINEPNSPRFWRGGAEALVHEYRVLKQWGRPVIGGNLTWLAAFNPEKWVRDLWDYGANGFMDYIGLHAYDGPGQATVNRYDEMAKVWRSAGFRQPFWVTEFGFNRNKFPASDEKVARWVSFALSKWSRKLDCVGATLYELYNDDSYGFSLIDPATGKPRPVMGRVQESVR